MHGDTGTNYIAFKPLPQQDAGELWFAAMIKPHEDSTGRAAKWIPNVRMSCNALYCTPWTAIKNPFLHRQQQLPIGS